MSYRSVWWYPNYVEYASGLNPPKTWPSVLEQYSRPNQLYDLRHYDVPRTESEDALYFRYPRLLPPMYRGRFRDKVPQYFPEVLDLPEGKPIGFHGRVYYEDGPPQFKYQGPKQDPLYYLEREPYLPKVPPSHVNVRSTNKLETIRGLNPSAEAIRKSQTQIHLRPLPRENGATSAASQPRASPDVGNKRLTQDGVGYL